MKRTTSIVAMLMCSAGCTSYSGPYNLTAMLADSSIFQASAEDRFGSFEETDTDGQSLA